MTATLTGKGPARAGGIKISLKTVSEFAVPAAVLAIVLALIAPMRATS